MSSGRAWRWSRRALIAGVMCLVVTLAGTTSPANAREAQPPQDEPSSQPPFDDGGGGSGDGGGGGSGDDGGGGSGGGEELPPEAYDEIQAVIDDVAEPVAASAENDAAHQFLVALLLKIADLQVRFGHAAPSGELIPHQVLDQIASELTAFLEPYARQICDNKLVLPGISEEVQARLAFRWWYPLVPPVFFVWLFGRKSICVSRLLERALHELITPCAIALGHFETFWVAVHGVNGGPNLFRSYDAARAADVAYLMSVGVPYAFAMQIADGSARSECVHN